MKQKPGDVIFLFKEKKLPIEGRRTHNAGVKSNKNPIE